jgi:hypothetical protein
VPALIGNLDSSPWFGKLHHKYVAILVAGRRRSGESDPLAVGRELSFGAARIGRVRTLPEVIELQLGWAVLKIHVDEVTAVRRPVVGDKTIALH